MAVYEGDMNSVSKSYVTLWQTISDYLSLAYNISLHMDQINDEFFKTQDAGPAKSRVITYSANLREKLTRLKALLEYEFNRVNDKLLVGNKKLKTLVDSIKTHSEKMEINSKGNEECKVIAAACTTYMKEKMDMNVLKMESYQHVMFMDLICEIKDNLERISSDILDQRSKDDLINRCTACYDLIYQFPHK